MDRPVVQGIRQVGLYAPDPTRLALFYQDVLGLQIVTQSKPNADGIRGSIFLGSRPLEDSYALLLFANAELYHTGFQVASLADLRAFHQLIVTCDLPIRWALNHGDSLAFYFADPAGNLIKLFWSTGVTYPQPHGHPIDLTQSEADLRQDVARLVAQCKVSNGG